MPRNLISATDQYKGKLIKSREDFEQRLIAMIHDCGENYGIDADFVDTKPNGELAFNLRPGDESHFSLKVHDFGLDGEEG